MCDTMLFAHSLSSLSLHLSLSLSLSLSFCRSLSLSRSISLSLSLSLSLPLSLSLLHFVVRGLGVGWRRLVRDHSTLDSFHKPQPAPKVS